MFGIVLDLIFILLAACGALILIVGLILEPLSRRYEGKSFDEHSEEALSLLD